MKGERFSIQVTLHTAKKASKRLMEQLITVFRLACFKIKSCFRMRHVDFRLLGYESIDQRRPPSILRRYMYGQAK